MTAQPPDPPALWAHARRMFARMTEAIGPVAFVAARKWILKPEQRRIRSWLNPIIALARKIVLIEALALVRLPPPPPKPPAPKPTHAVPKRTAPPRQRTPALRLWPRPLRHPARITLLGPPTSVREIWREQIRAAKVQRMKIARYKRLPPGVSIARRIEALAQLIDKPLAAARRLARKLRAVPRLVLKLIKRRPAAPSRHYRDIDYRPAFDRSFNDAIAWLYNTS